MQRLSGLDAAFLYYETPSTHTHVAAIMIIDPSSVEGGYSFAHVKEVVRERLHLVPQFRRKIAFVPFNLGHPYWVEDADFDLDYHVRRIGAPTPGGPEELAEIAGDIASRKLDRSRPLWEMWVVEGLQDGNIAVVSKMHHSTIDGVSGANLMVHLFDLEPNPAPKPPPEKPWQPEPEPSDLSLVAHALPDLATRPIKMVTTVGKTLGAVANFTMTRMRSSGPGMPTPGTAPRTSFNAPITPHRNVAYCRVSLTDVKDVKNAFGTTVNDVVLAVCSGALRRYLQEVDGVVPDKSLFAAVPVSVHGQTQTEGQNQVSVMFSSLYSDIDDPVERLKAIHEANKGAKEEHKAIGADLLQNWVQFAAPTTFAVAARIYSALGLAERTPVIHNCVISNVPGPPIPLYIAGSRVVALYPLGPIMTGAGLNITVISNMDAMDFGFIACRELMPQLWGLAEAIPDALAELHKAAEATGPTGG